MNWFIAALLSALLFAISNALTKGFSSRLNLFTGLLFFTIGGLLVPLLGFLVTKTPFIKFAHSAAPRALWGMMASGFVWAWATYMFLDLLSRSTALSVVLPIIVGGIGIGGVVAGVLFFGETISTTQIGAIVLVLIGSILLGRG
jgi:drug/metabolite transporter (DMT)-like permease